MKIRTGFVSNSSSSNFIIIGVAAGSNSIPRDEFNDIDYELLNKLELDLISPNYDEDGIIGEVVANGEDLIDDGDLSLEQIAQKINEVTKKLNKLNITGQVKLFYGSRYS